MKEKMIKVLKNKRVMYLSFSVLLILFSLALNLAFAAFTNKNITTIANIKVRGMEYQMKIDNVLTKIVKGDASSITLATVEITGMNSISSKYELVYQVCTTSGCSAYTTIPTNFEVKYVDNTPNPVTGEITATGVKTIKIAIVNDTTNDVWIELGINAGYTHNTLALEGLIINEYKENIAHFIINLPSPASGFYNANKLGAVWDAKLGGLRISSVSTPSTTYNLTNAYEPSLPSLVTFVKGLGNSDGVYAEVSGADTNYRYEGANPNNYVSFNGELWRIIGTFNANTHGKTGQELVKIIRDTSIGGLAWQKNNVNDWEDSMSSLKMLLNNFYYNGTNESTITHCNSTIPGNCNFIKNGITNTVYRNMIENVTWYLGGRADASATASTFYSAERGTTVYAGRPISGTGYIGLMYPSDYGYSVLSNSCARMIHLGSYNTAACGGNAWLLRGDYEWTLTPNSDDTASGFNVYNSGYVYSNNVGLGFSVRPVLYLKSTVKILAGNGSVATPYIIVP